MFGLYNGDIYGDAGKILVSQTGILFWCENVTPRSCISYIYIYIPGMTKGQCRIQKAKRDVPSFFGVETHTVAENLVLCAAAAESVLYAHITSRAANPSPHKTRDDVKLSRLHAPLLGECSLTSLRADVAVIAQTPDPFIMYDCFSGGTGAELAPGSVWKKLVQKRIELSLTSQARPPAT